MLLFGHSFKIHSVIHDKSYKTLVQSHGVRLTRRDQVKLFPYFCGCLLSLPFLHVRLVCAFVCDLSGVGESSTSVSEVDASGLSIYTVDDFGSSISVSTIGSCLVVLGLMVAGVVIMSLRFLQAVPLGVMTS